LKFWLYRLCRDYCHFALAGLPNPAAEGADLAIRAEQFPLKPVEPKFFVFYLKGGFDLDFQHSCCTLWCDPFARNYTPKYRG
jgi:hypothetical protein